MNCQETQKLIHGFVDGELDLMKNLEIDQHLQECAACAQAHADLQALRAAIKDGSPYFRPPPDLQIRIQSSLRRTSEARPATRLLPRRWLAIAASLAFVALAGWGLARLLPVHSANPLVTQELLASHVRSQMLPGHQLDVESSDQHTVKPWFDGKLDFSPPVPDLKSQGFSLLGGRLDYLDNRSVATLVYQRRKHFIDLFIWPSTQDSEAAANKVTRQGYHLFNWTQSDLTYWAVSNLNESELEQFVRLIQEKAR